ncbi:MAG: DHHW family protein [Lachnospiraceae bacterium]
MEKKSIGRRLPAPAILLLVFLLGGMAAGLLTKPRTFSENENRNLAQKPKLTLSGILDGSYEEDFENYLTDQFPLRDNWISLKTRAELAMGKREVNGVYFASDNYLLETHLSVDETAGEENAEKAAAFLRNEAAELGSSHVQMMLVPAATGVLSDKLPAHAVTWDQEKLISTFREDCASGSGGGSPLWVDVDSALAAHKEEPIFYRTDHHWTTLGAYYGYGAYEKALGEEPLPVEDFTKTAASNDFLGTVYSKVGYARQKDTLEIWTPTGQDAKAFHLTADGTLDQDSLYVTSYLDTKDKYSTFLGGNHALAVITNTNDEKKHNEKTLLVIKDSFANCLVPFLANHYDRIVLVDLRYLKQKVSDICDEYDVTDVLLLYNTVHFTEANFALLQ